MKATACRYLDIYPDTIEHYVGMCESFVNSLGLDENDMHRRAKEYLEENGSFENVTNSVIGAYFDAVKSCILEELQRDRLPDSQPDISVYVNMDDSHFFFGDVEVHNGDDLMEEVHNAQWTAFLPEIQADIKTAETRFRTEAPGADWIDRAIAEILEYTKNKLKEDDTYDVDNARGYISEEVEAWLED